MESFGLNIDPNAKTMRFNGHQDVEEKPLRKYLPLLRLSEADGTSAFHGEGSGTAKSKTSNKRKATDEVEERFLNAMTSFIEKTESRLGDIARRNGFEQDSSAKRVAVFDALNEIQFILVEDKIAVSKQLCDDGTYETTHSRLTPSDNSMDDANYEDRNERIPKWEVQVVPGGNGGYDDENGGQNDEDGGQDEEPEGSVVDIN
ncbi:hypothetical protein DH2020_005080 [Rehmannia glutinosa]|uniref:Uncharacterized protein n=1 Tax=Rehmannia glutinosa TaxID=99300 RepID=A0ABR0XRV3_REHGL